METGSYLSLFTTGFGWHYSSVLWQVLAGTGLIFLPILGIVYDHITDIRSDGSLSNVDPDRALAGLEVKFVTLLFVLLIAAVPTSLTAFAPGTLRYTQPAGIFNEEKRELTLGSDTYTLDDTIGSLEPVVTTINIPAWWYLVMRISGGVNKALTGSIEDGGEGFRAIKQIADTASIQDPVLRNEVDIMFTDCYARAVSIYQADTVAPITLPEGLHQDIGAIDINWIGSKYLYDNYYARIHSRPVKGFTHNPAVSTQFAGGDNLVGQPNCQQLWDHIQGKTFGIATAEGVDDYIKNAEKRGLDIFSNPETQRDAFEREIVQIYIHNTPKNITLPADKIQALRSDGDGFFAKVASKFSDAASAVGLTKAALLFELAQNALIDALVTIQAFLLMLLYIFIPLGMLVSRYSVSFLMQMGLLLFSIHMWPTVWTFAAWLDNNLAKSLYVGQGAIATLVDGSIQEYNKRIIHSISVIFLYVSGPAVISWVLIAAGARAAGSAGASGAASTVGVGAAVQGAAGGAIGAAAGAPGRLAKSKYKQRQRAKAGKK